MNPKSSESYLRDQLEKSFRESKLAKQRIESLEKENVSLKKSLYDLSTRYNMLAHKITGIGGGGASAAAGGANIVGASNAGNNTGNGVIIDGGSIAAASLVNANLRQFTVFEPFEPTPDLNALTPSAEGGVNTNSQASDTGAGSMTESGSGGKTATTSANNPADQTSELGDKKRVQHFVLKNDLKGHTGAVYSVRFSPCGKYIASGSFDKSVRVWDMQGSPKELHCLKKHSLNVSDLWWSKDSSLLLSGAYDQTCKVWSTETGKMIESIESEGFVQCVSFDPTSDQVFFNGTSRNVLAVVDRRKPEQAISMRNDSMVNSILVYRDGVHVLSADALGCLKTWDIRMKRFIQSFLNESTKKPISHITACPMASDDEEPRYIGVNSYDNVIRVYDRGNLHPQSAYKLSSMLKGYKNKNWPIKSSFYFNRDGRGKRTISHEEIFSKADLQSEGENSDKSWAQDGSTLLATGSADPYVYVYNINEGSSELVQRLEGHTDRVYAVNFHPYEPILASCSADFTVKVFSKGKRN